jgi:F0F1-type ATP synthase membrane subunit b/b'
MKSLADTEAKRLENIKERIDEIQARILEMGNKEKAKIVEQGKIAADKMIEEARTYASYRLAMAKKALSGEMVDLAISMVEEKLVRKMTEEDDERILAKFIDNLKAPKPH